MNDGQLKFDPPVQEISLAWGQFCDLLSVAAYRSLQSSRLVFETIRKQMNQSDPAQQPEPIHSIKVCHLKLYGLIELFEFEIEICTNSGENSGGISGSHPPGHCGGIRRRQRYVD
jgi:hypothetical protein